MKVRTIREQFMREYGTVRFKFIGNIYLNSDTGTMKHDEETYEVDDLGYFKKDNSFDGQIYFTEVLEGLQLGNWKPVLD